MPRLSHALTLSTCLALPLPALAQTVLSGDYSIDGFLCVGNACTGSETFDAFDDLKIKGSAIGILFEDTEGSSTHDWRLQANATNEDSFFLRDVTDGTTPFKILGFAPDNSLFVDSDGEIGLGTSVPQARLHVETTASSGIRINRSNTSAGQQAWETYIDPNGKFAILDATNTTAPIGISPGTPSGALLFGSTRTVFNNASEDFNFEVRGQAYRPLIFANAGTGRVGIGTDGPDAPLEVSSNETFSYFRITAEQAAINKSVDVTFTGGPLGTGELRYNIVDGDGPEMKLNANGDIEIGGTLTTGGPTCASGCDAVFDAEFERLSVTEHAALMWDKGYLPAVGPTLPGQPMNISEKMGAVLNELEHAHIYIEELHRENAAREARFEARIATLTARLDALETGD